ncbi:MAG: cytochrome c oxidase subunit II [Acidobacteriota bacterium]|nr:cytochrome c oxidase subunit II [Acidobacteriota bacterium]
MVQSLAALVSLVLALIVVAVALVVVRRASRRDPAGYANVYRVRRYYAIGLIGALAVLLALTLARTPYAVAAAPPPDLKVEAFGWMWAWEFVVDGESRGPRIELPAGKLVEFAVSARDVNHGFGIYDPQGRLVAQTQAMPGYVNPLRVRFDEPGTYHVLCLEYCGLGHAVMMGEISVQ